MVIHMFNYHPPRALAVSLEIALAQLNLNNLIYGRINYMYLSQVASKHFPAI